MGRASDWCILRTSGRHTLSLAETLTADGFEVWTPVETVPLRARRSHPASEVSEALMPSYIFARADRLKDLLALARNPSQTYRVWDAERRRMVTKGHHFFRVMHALDDSGEPALLPEAQLAPLRRIERRKLSKAKILEFAVGDRVKMTDGSYAGLYGAVTECGSSCHEVLLDGWAFAVKVQTWLLYPEVDEGRHVGVCDGQALSAKAA